MKVSYWAIFFTTLLSSSAQAERNAAPKSPIQQLIPDGRLSKIKAALPEVSDPKLSALLKSDDLLWYDEEAMTPSYQDSLGANANHSWPDLVAGSESVISGLFNRRHKRWQFPFSTTAGTDRSTNLIVADFVYLPQQDGRVRSIPIHEVLRNYNRPQWEWDYHEGTVFGEVLFIQDGSRILPTEIRTRRRLETSWAMNVYRPFPTAESLADAINLKRPDWEAASHLRRMMAFLDDETTLVRRELAAKAALAPTFRQEGWLDPLPDFGDPELVRELLTSTTFVSSYETPWKKNGAAAAHAPTTVYAPSIVPTHYEAGVIQVTDESCMRCHQETGRLVSEFYFDLYLYGELWGKDGIFTFHPYDESRYPELRTGRDNRSIRPELKKMGVFHWVGDQPMPYVGESEGDVGAEDQAANDGLPEEGITYSSHIKPIIDDHCVECHSPRGKKPTLSQFPFVSTAGEELVDIVEKMITRVSAERKKMPPGNRPRLKSREIKLLKAWLDEGLQED